MKTVADRYRLAAYHNKHCWWAFRWYQHRWPWTTLNPKNRGFSEFLTILGCDTHFKSELRRNQDRPGQPAYEMFSIKRRFQRCKVWPSRFKDSSVWAHQIWVPPSKRAVSATVVQSNKITVADRHRLAAHHNKRCWRAFRGYKHRWPWTTELVTVISLVLTENKLWWALLWENVIRCGLLLKTCWNSPS